MLINKPSAKLIDTQVVLSLRMYNMYAKLQSNQANIIAFFVLKYWSCSFFSACKPREDKVFKTFDENFIGLNKEVTLPHRRQESSARVSPSSEIIYQM